jgi:hypothetical protein
VANSHNPLILENGAKWDRVGITAKDAQLLELLQYSTSDIARIFGVPPHMIGDVDKSTSWGTGIEQQGIGFVRYTLLPHLRRQAAELSRKLFPVQGAKVSPLYIDFDPEAMLVGDAKTQGEFYRVALGGNQLPGFMSVNEVRACRGLQPVPGGDKVYIPTAAPTAADPATDPATDPGRSRRHPPPATRQCRDLCLTWRAITAMPAKEAPASGPKPLAMAIPPICSSMARSTTVGASSARRISAPRSPRSPRPRCACASIRPAAMCARRAR